MPPRKTAPTATVPTATGFMVAEENFVSPIPDLNATFILYPAATYRSRMKGTAMKDAGIPDHSYYIFDTSLVPKNGQIVHAWHNDQWYCRFYKKDQKSGMVTLTAADKSIKPIELLDKRDRVLGVVTWVFKCVSPLYFRELENW